MTQRSTQLSAVTRPEPLAWLLNRWHRGPGHPFKQRLIRLAERLLGPGRLVAQTTSGFRFSVDHADLIQRTVLHTGCWETEETEFFNQDLRLDDVLYDIGSNVGYFTCLALARGVRHVVAFDPDPLNIDVLRLNLRLNGFDQNRWSLINEGVGARTEIAKFHRAHVANTGVSGFGRATAVETFPVPLRSLDDFLAANLAPMPTVLKVDVEGWEQHVFEGATTLLRLAPPRLILFEAACDSAGRMTNTSLRQQLMTAGYEISRLKQAPPKDTNDNYIARRC